MGCTFMVVAVLSLASVALADERLPKQITDLPPEANQFLKTAIVLLLPHDYTDDDDWNRHKKIQSGLNVDFKGGRLKTSRRYKEVRHGTWERIDAKLVSPETFFQLKVQIVPATESRPAVYRVTASVRIDAQATQQRWQRGVQLYSATAAGIADVTVMADIEFSNQSIEIDGKQRPILMPTIHAAHVQLRSFRLKRLGKLKGKAVGEMSNMFEAIMRAAIKRKNAKLVSKINSKIAKKPERFELPAPVAAFLGVTIGQEDSNDESS